MRVLVAFLLIGCLNLCAMGHGARQNGVLHLHAAQAAPAEPSIDPSTGLVVAPGWELVSAHCGACHSHRLVTAQRGDARFWLSTIRWMQRTQNLWEIPPEQENTIVGYLESHYNETDWGRRPPLAASQMPGKGR